MSHFKPNYFQRRSKPQGPKANERIRAIDVQVIGSDGNNLGTLPLNKAIEVAKNEGLDLIEISPNANPPVCKIMDMGKYKYDLQKKTNIQITFLHNHYFLLRYGVQLLVLVLTKKVVYLHNFQLKFL